MNKTGIEWCTHTWNPITGCTPCSPGCKNCFAERMAKRLRGRFGYPDDNPFRVTHHRNKIDQPKHWRKPSRIFICSMSDLFHEDVWFDDIDFILDVVRECPQHTFLALTKRAHRLPLFNEELHHHNLTWPSNLHLGVSISNQEEADEKIPLLLETSAAVKFISYEPALAGIKIARHLPGLSWVIAGCESGPNRRPAKLDWF